jgi:hypothetical protein
MGLLGMLVKPIHPVCLAAMGKIVKQCAKENLERRLDLKCDQISERPGVFPVTKVG